MMPEIGNGLLCLALGIALLLSVYPLWGVARGDARMMASSRLFAAAVYVCGWRISGAGQCFRGQRLYRHLCCQQLQYPASGVVSRGGYRGAHEGSLLLWVLLMSGWTFAVAIFSQRIPLDIVARVLAIMGMVSVGFCCSFSLPLTRSHARCRISRLKGVILTHCCRIRG